jgi:hypothetical protein
VTRRRLLTWARALSLLLAAVSLAVIPWFGATTAWYAILLLVVLFAGPVGALLRRLDERLLGPRVLAIVATVAAALFAAGAVWALTADHPGLGAVYSVTGAWTGYWAAVRWSSLRRVSPARP